MTTVQISLNSIEKVKSFVNDIARFDSDFDLVSGRYVIDAKSIMGIFSLDLSKPISLNIHGDEDAEILETLKSYIVELIEKDMASRPEEVKKVIDKLNEEHPQPEFDKFDLKENQHYIKCTSCGFDTVVQLEEGQKLNYRKCPRCSGIMHKAVVQVKLDEKNDGLKN